jgi:hypothetical protein
VPSQRLSGILNSRLANNGGPTQTHALVAGIPAADAINDGTCPPPAKDQRGVKRPQDGNGDGGPVCDIGSFELAVGVVAPLAPPTATVSKPPGPPGPTGPSAPPEPGGLQHRRHRLSHYPRLTSRRSQRRSRHHPRLTSRRHFISSRASSADQYEIAQRYLAARSTDNLWAGRHKNISFAERARCRTPNTAGRSALTMRPGCTKPRRPKLVPALGPLALSRIQHPSQAASRASLHS